MGEDQFDLKDFPFAGLHILANSCNSVILKLVGTIIIGHPEVGLFLSDYTFSQLFLAIGSHNLKRKDSCVRKAEHHTKYNFLRTIQTRGRPHAVEGNSKSPFSIASIVMISCNI